MKNSDLFIFLEALYKDSDPKSFIEIRLIKDKKVKQEFVMVEQMDEIPNRVKSYIKQKWNIHYGVAPRSTRAGKKSNILEVPSLWVDIDPPKGLSFSEGDLMSKLSVLREEFYPSAVIHSGNGFHLYWFLNKTTKDFKGIEKLNKYLGKAIGGDLSCAEYARILRLPSTFNYKSTTEKSVRLLSIKSKRYKLKDFNNIILSELEQSLPKALETAFVNISSMDKGNRNNTLNKESYKLGNLIRENTLEREVAEKYLRKAAHLAGMDDRKDTVDSTINSGLEAGIESYQPKIIPQNEPFNIQTITAKDLLGKDFPDIRWAIPGILPEGLTVLAGPPKIGKSWLAYGLSLAVAMGTIAMNKYKITKPGKALYLALEDNERRLQTRLIQLTKEGAVNDNLLLSCELPKFDDGGFQALQDWINTNKDCRLIIIDTLGRFTPKPKHRGTAYDNDYQYMAQLQKLAIESQIAILVITHHRKQEGQDKLDKITGSVGITGASDSAWFLERGRNQADAKLLITGRDVEEKELALSFDPKDCFWKVLGDADEYELSSSKKQILDCLKEVDEAIGPRKISQLTGLKEGTVKGTLSRMASECLIYRESKGKYFFLKED